MLSSKTDKTQFHSILMKDRLENKAFILLAELSAKRMNALFSQIFQVHMPYFLERKFTVRQLLTDANKE